MYLEGAQRSKNKILIGRLQAESLMEKSRQCRECGEPQQRQARRLEHYAMKNRTIPIIIMMFLSLTIARSVIAQDQRGTDALPLVVKLITDRATPLPVKSSTDWPVLLVALTIGILQLIVFGIQSYLLWETVLSSNLP